MKQDRERLFLYVKDVMKLRECSKSTAKRIVASIRKRYTRTATKGITIMDFCDYYGAVEYRVKKMLND